MTQLLAVQYNTWGKGTWRHRSTQMWMIAIPYKVTGHNVRSVRITWIPSRTRTRCGDGNQVLQFASFWSESISEKLVGILIRAIASIDSVDCIPESFFITTELTCTIRKDKSSIHSGTSELSGRSKQSIITVLSCNDFWNPHISLKVKTSSPHFDNIKGPHFNLSSQVNKEQNQSEAGDFENRKHKQIRTDYSIKNWNFHPWAMNQ